MPRAIAFVKAIQAFLKKSFRFLVDSDLSQSGHELDSLLIILGGALF